MSDSPTHNPSTSGQPRTLLLATDNTNSILAELAGHRPNPIAYSAYGGRSAHQEVATGLGFNGALREKHIGWYLLGNGYRAYNPTLMRFHSPDSWSPFGGGGLNAYMYCVGDPVNFSDPTGHIRKGFFSNLFKSGSKTETTSEPPLTALKTSERTATPNQYLSIQSPSSSTSTPIGSNTTAVPPTTPTHVMVRLPSSSSPPEEMMTFQEWGDIHRPRVHAPVSLPIVRSSNNDPTSGHTLVMAQDRRVRISLNRPPAETRGGIPNPPTVHPDGQTIGLRLRLNSPVKASSAVRET